MTYRGLARLLLLLPLVGCREPTQITVQLFSDLPCDALQSSGIALSASSPDRAEASPPLVVARDCSTGANNNSIGTLVLVPSGDPDALVGIRAVAGVSKQAEACEAPGYEGCIVARREVRFQENRALVVKIDLLASCEGNPCDPKTTCVAGEECRGSKVPEGACEGAGCGEEALPPASGGAGGAAGQGGKGGGGAGGLSGSSGQGGAGGSAGQGGTSGDGGGGIAGSSGQGGAGEAGQGGAGEAGAAGVGGGEAGAGGEPGGQGGAGQGGEGGGGSAGAAGEGGAGQGGIAGQSGSAGEGGAGGCVPKTCEQLNANCGTVDDGCGKPISCQQKECTSQACTDGCIGGLSCGANFAGVCGCKPGTTSCAGDDLHQCSVEGNLLKQIKQCEENKCTPAGCSAFSGSWCEGQVYHNGFGGEETCNNSSQVCAAYLGCVQCLPSTYFCKGSDLYFCNDFAALPPMVLVNSCGSVAACQKGASLGFCPG